MKVVLHDVADLESFLNGCLNDYLRRHGAFLRSEDREDAIQDLALAAVKEAKRWNSELSHASFSKHCYYRIVETGWWMTNFYRAHRGDARYEGTKAPEFVQITADDRPIIEAAVFGPEILEMVNTALLSPMARHTLENIVIPFTDVDKGKFSYRGAVEEFPILAKGVLNSRLRLLRSEIMEKQAFLEAA